MAAPASIVGLADAVCEEVVCEEVTENVGVPKEDDMEIGDSEARNNQVERKMTK